VIWKGDVRVMVPLSLLFALTVGERAVPCFWACIGLTLRLATGLLHDLFCVPALYAMVSGVVTLVFICAFLAFNITGLTLVTLKLWRVNRALKWSGYPDKHVASTLSILAQMAALYVILAGFTVPTFVDGGVFGAVVEQLTQFIVVRRGPSPMCS
jgi:hypothetical protein